MTPEPIMFLKLHRIQIVDGNQTTFKNHCKYKVRFPIENSADLEKFNNYKNIWESIQPYEPAVDRSNHVSEVKQILYS